MYNAYGQSISLERINNQIQELEKLKNQIQQPAPITQNFQIAPTNNTLKYANSISDVERDFVRMLKSEAGSQEEMQLIREYTQKISQM